MANKVLIVKKPQTNSTGHLASGKVTTIHSIKERGERNKKKPDIYVCELSTCYVKAIANCQRMIELAVHLGEKIRLGMIYE